MASTGRKLFLLMGTSVILLGLSSCASTKPQSPHDAVMLISQVVAEDKRKTICASDSSTVIDFVSALAIYEKQHPSAYGQLSEAYIQTALSQAFPCSSDSKKVTLAQTPGPELETSADTLGSRASLQVYAEGLGAYQRKDYATAFTLFKGASDAGDVRASQALGNMYLLGLGVEKNISHALGLYERAAKGGNILAMNMLAGIYLGQQGVEKNLSLSREWARRSARAGNAEGAFLLFRALLIDPDLEYRETGKANIEKYNKLAKRPAGERFLEIEGYNMLARAARQGHLQARMLLATVYVDKPGEDNNRKALAIYQSIPNLPEPLERVKQQLLKLQSQGETRATVKLVGDTAQTALMSSLLRAGLKEQVAVKQCPTEKTKILSMTVSKPLEDAEYLPLSEPEVQKAYLMRGTWEETWTYDVCGKEVRVPIMFSADGFGGAHYHTQFNPKQPAK